jgi:hypothetical protein
MFDDLHELDFEEFKTLVHTMNIAGDVKKDCHIYTKMAYRAKINIFMLVVEFAKVENSSLFFNAPADVLELASILSGSKRTVSEPL